MSVHAYRARRVTVLGGSALAALFAVGSMASAQNQPAQDQPAQGQSAQAPSTQEPVASAPSPATPTSSAAYAASSSALRRRLRKGAVGGSQLPQITVTAPIRKPAPRQVVRRPPPPTVPPVSPAEQLTAKQNGFDASAQQSLHHHRHDIGHDQPRHHRGAAARHQCDGRESAAAGAGRVAGFRGERLAPCPQRPRQCAIPHQRRDAARRRHRLRQRSRHRPDRQHLADHRRAAGRIRHAHGGADRHHDPQRHFQQFGQHQLLRRQPRHDRAELRLWRHFRRELPVERGCARNGKAVIRGLDVFRRRPILLHRQLSADHGGHRKSAADAQRHPRFLAAGKRLRLYVDLRRPLYALKPDRGNRHCKLPDSQRSRRADFFGNHSAGVRTWHFQFSTAQRKPIRANPIRRAGAAAIDQRLRRADFLLHPLQRSALHAGSGWRPPLERHRFGHQPAILRQRHPGRRVLPDQPGAYGSRGLHRQRRTKLGRQYIARAIHSRRRFRWNRSPTTSTSSAGSPASMPRTSGKSPTS